MVTTLNTAASLPEAMPATHRAELLRSLVSLASAAANPQLEAYAPRLAAALLLQSEQSADSKLANLSFNAANLLKKNAYPFYFLVSGRLLAVLQQAMRGLDHAAGGMREHDGDLSLVSYEEIESRVLLGNLCRPLAEKHAGQLNALGMRLAFLTGREEMAPAEHPFRPELFVQAIDEAWREFNPDQDSYSLLLPLLGLDLLPDLSPILKGVNDALIAKGILPQLPSSFQIRKTAANRELPRAVSSDPALLQQLRSLLSAPGAMSGGAPLAAQAPAAGAGQAMHSLPVARPQLFDYLAGLQKAMFERHVADDGTGTAPSMALLGNIKRQTPPGALSAVDENTIDLLGTVFDVIFRDQHIAPEIKSLIGFLQVPVLKAALLDKEFFFDHAHPARRMIDVLAKASVGWDEKEGARDPLFQALKRNVERVQREFDQQVSVFSDVVSDLEAFIRDDEAAEVGGLAAPIDSALRQEKLGQARRAAQTEVALRIGSGEVVAFVETFLENRWVPVLTIAYARAESQPQAVSSALKTMDDLIWSVKPKITLEQRKELIAKLPSMLAMLNKWLNLVEWDDSDRLQFFAELAECHASIVRAPVNLSPERQLELALEVAQKAAERRLEKQAAAKPEPPPDEFVEQLAQLHSGMWLEFAQPDGSQKKVKLAWVSPMRSLYIFTTRDRQESFSISDLDLAQAFRQHGASVVPLAGLLDRALTQALEDMGANDAQHQAVALA